MEVRRSRKQWEDASELLLQKFEKNRERNGEPTEWSPHSPFEHHTTYRSKCCHLGQLHSISFPKRLVRCSQRAKGQPLALLSLPMRHRDGGDAQSVLRVGYKVLGPIRIHESLFSSLRPATLEWPSPKTHRYPRTRNRDLQRRLVRRRRATSN